MRAIVAPLPNYLALARVSFYLLCRLIRLEVHYVSAVADLLCLGTRFWSIFAYLCGLLRVIGTPLPIYLPLAHIIGLPLATGFAWQALSERLC